MRFLRGLMAGISGSIIFGIGLLLGASNCIGSTGINTQCATNTINPTFSITMILGVVMMIGGPLYYWILEPIVRPRKANKNRKPKGQPKSQYQPQNQQSYQQQPQQQAPNSQPVNPASYNQPANLAQYNQPVNQQK